MSVEAVRSELRRFLTSDDCLAICLSGKWGVGKTYTWNELLKNAFNNSTVKPAKYAYVSLFGLETLGDVRRSLFENTVESAAFQPKSDLEPTMESASNRLSQLASKWRAGAAIARGLPIIADYGGLAEKMGFLDVKNQIVCVDDLERISDKLKVKDVLGLVSDLKEKKNCKVILLLNSEMLNGGNADDFRTQLEKVIDVQLEFSPNPEEAAAIAIPDRAREELELVANNTIKLGITNIRTIFKLIRIATRLTEILSTYDKRILKQAIHSACLFGMAVYQPKDAPPIEAIVNSKPYQHLFGDKKEKSADEMRWSDLLHRYGYGSTDELDLQILDGILKGYFNIGEINAVSEKVSADLELKDKDQSYTKAWDMYHDSFEDNGAEFASKLRQSISDNSAAISPSNLSVSIEILKKIGQADNIDKVIENYISSRNEDRKFWAGDHFSLRSQISDPDVRAAFKSKAEEFSDDRSLISILESIVRNSGWNEEDIDFIDRQSEDDIYKLLKSLRGDELRKAIYGITYFRNIGNADEKMQSITAKALAALRRVGSESAINRCRVEKFGIEIA